MALTGKRELFAREYLKDLNATQAATRAGYAPAGCAVEGCRLLADPLVQAHIAELAAERNEELKINARDVLLELHRIASQDPAALVDENEVPHKLSEIPIDLRRTIASLEIEELYAGRGEERTSIGRLHKIKFWNKNHALESLGRHLALFKDSLDLSASLKLDASDMETSALVAAILEAARVRRENSDLV